MVSEAEHRLSNCCPVCGSPHLHQGLLCTCEAGQVYFFVSQRFIVLTSREGRRRGENSPLAAESVVVGEPDLCPTCPPLPQNVPR